jgi:hypothetical protein
MRAWNGFFWLEIWAIGIVLYDVCSLLTSLTLPSEEELCSVKLFT